MKYEYFIVYTITRHDRTSVGNTVFVLDGEIDSLEGIRQIEEKICASLNAPQAAVTNFRLLKTTKA